MSTSDENALPGFGAQRDEWDALLYARGEMSPDDKVAFEERLQNSEQLGMELALVERTVEILQELPDCEPAQDLIGGVLKAIERPAPQLRVVPSQQGGRSRWVAVAHVAALLFVAVGLWSLIGHLNSGDATRRTGEPAGSQGAGLSASLEQEKSDSVVAAVQWLQQSQETDGSWDPRRWQGRRRIG